jgi:hypothetical protein
MSPQHYGRDIIIPLDTPPALYDGFGFYKDPTDGQVKFYYFDDVIKEHGPEPRDPAVPEDREAYHVMLSSIFKHTVHMDAPFISHFIDPFVYATGLAHSGFSGVMLKKTRWSANVMLQSLNYLRSLHLKDQGYTYTDESGTTTTTFYPGAQANT